MERLMLMGALVLGIVSSFCLPARADEETETQTKIDRNRIEKLVELLASKNIMPVDETHSLEAPSGYKKTDQVIVFLTIQQLLQEGGPAFDVLIEHLDDQRYSISYEAPSGVYNSSVGSICARIMLRSIYCYQDLGTLREITSGQRYMHEIGQEKLSDWWKKNRHRPLWKIQVDMIDHQIKYFRKLDLAKAPRVHPYAERLPLKTLEELRSLNIAKLEAMRTAIMVMKEPYRPKSIDQPYGRLTWLPWVTDSFNK